MDVTPFHSFERTRLVDHVTHQLRELILSGELPPGTPLLQVALAERLGVSRTPLREAIRVIEGDGLLRVSNGNRTVEVVSFSPAELHDLYRVREVIDGLAARLAAFNGLPEEIDREIRQALSEMDDAIGRPHDHEQQVLAHVAFHVGIARACGNSRVVGQIPLIRVTASSLHYAMRSATPQERSELLMAAQSHHHGIYRAISEGNGREAEKLARRHISVTRRSGLVERTAAQAAEELRKETTGG